MQKNTKAWTLFALFGAQLAILAMAVLVGHFL